jgi:DNA polymerase I-like protein with 3'-5' exonuclease and polymerase domains
MPVKPPPTPRGREKKSGGYYEEPFEVQKARQDEAREVPEMEEAAFYGTVGLIAKKLAEVTEADKRALLVGLLAGCGSIIGRTAYYKIGATKHFCNEFICLVGRTAKARKGTATDFVEETLRLLDESWHSSCIAHGLSTGEGLIELVSDEITKLVKVKPPKGAPPGPAKFEKQTVKEGVKDKRKLCLLPEFGELLLVSTRDGNIINTVLRNTWDGKRLEINTKQQPQRASGAHISILGNVTRDELLKLIPFLPSTNGFCNRFLWCVIERKRRVPDGGPSPAEHVPEEISKLQKILRQIPLEQFAVSFAPETLSFWEGEENQENGLYDDLEHDSVPAITSRGAPHVLRLAMIHALLDGSRTIQLCHLNAALAAWRYCEAGAIQLFGVRELERDAHLILDHLRAKGSLGATRTEIQNRVFHNHKTGTEISDWLRKLEEKKLAWYRTEKNDCGNNTERWFATLYSEPEPSRKPDKGAQFAQFAHNSQTSANSSSRSQSQSPGEKRHNSHFSQGGTKDKKTESHKKSDSPPQYKYAKEGAKSANCAREAAPAKDGPIRSPCELSAKSAKSESGSGFAGRNTTNSYLYVIEKTQVSHVLGSLSGDASIGLDTETNDDKLRLIQLCDGSSPPVVLDIPRGNIKDELTKFLRDKELIIQNSKFDLRVLKNAFELEIPVSRVFDTYVASAVLTNTKVTKELKTRRRRNWQPNRLDSIAQRTLGLILDKTLQNADWSVDLSLPENAPMLAYAANDVRHLHAIRLHLWAELESQKLIPVYELERDLIPCVNAMSENGVCVDLGAVRRLAAETVELTAKREAVVLSLLKQPINLRSRKAQLLPALQELGLTIDGVPLASTDKKVLPLVDQKNHPAVTALLDWSTSNEEAKQLAQWPKHIDSDGVVRPQINQFGTETARFTYSSPNLQQVKKSALRSIIIAPPGHLILRADFKTIELILAAVRYGETAILEQVAKGVDLHTVTASSPFHCTLKDVLESQRNMAKTTNFSLLYGRSLAAYIQACRLAGIDITAEELERIYRDFDKAWPNWAAYKTQITRQIARRTYPRELRSMYGRRIVLDVSLSNRELRGALLNFPIQSSGSDVLKLTMVNVWQEKPKGFRLLASIHDEILAVLKPDRINYAKALLREAAIDAVRRVQHNNIPIPLEMGVGRNWWEAIQDKEETNK